MFQRIMDQQHRRPVGPLGLYVGNRMVSQHRPEHLWTIAILQPQPADHILELGFGAGFAIQELAKVITQGRIAGIDFSKTMVMAARWRNGRAVRQGRVELRYGDVASLPFADERFDKAFSIHSVYFWPRPAAVLKEVRRVLKPGGRLVLTILPQEKWPGGDGNEALGMVDCRPYSGEELTCLLAEAGFGNTDIQADSDPEQPSNYSVIGIKSLERSHKPGDGESPMNMEWQQQAGE